MYWKTYRKKYNNEKKRSGHGVIRLLIFVSIILSIHHDIAKQKIESIVLIEQQIL